jgi:tetratricopeptide (TPR) repeat protein
MQAVLNGMSGTGLLIEGDQVSLLRLDDNYTAVPGSFNELPDVLGDARSIDFLSVANADEAFETLRLDHARQESLDLALILLDRDLSDETRTEAATVLNHMLLDWDLRSWLEGVLYGAPLPSEADMDGALRNARDVAGTAVAGMLSRLSDLQPEIARVCEAWNSVCARVLRSPDARHEGTVLAARNGVFRYLVHAAEGAKYDDFRFAALKVLQPVTEYRRIVGELIGELKLRPSSRKQIAEPMIDVEGTKDLLDEDRKDAEYLRFDRAAVFENVKRQKDAIVGHMRASRFDLVRRYVDELVEYQLPLDHRAENTSKSLCDLAMEAKALELFELQLELANRAVHVRYQDGWAWAQVGDASLILNKFDDALTAYRHAIEFQAESVGRVGYGQVLISMGRLDEALAIFDDAVRVFPNDAVVKTGRAEVFKSMGRLDEALLAYDAIAREFPEQVIPKNGRAEVLKFLGKMDEALEAYDATGGEFPNDLFAKTGRAEVLKAMGRLDDALSAYGAVVQQFPNNPVALSGRAEVLKAIGRLDDALVAYDAIGAEFPNDVASKNGRAEVLKAMGRLDAALAAYDTIGAKFPNDTASKNGRAEVLKSMGRLDDALAAYDAVVLKFPSNVIAKTGHAEVLKSMGRLDEALVAYDAVVLNFPSDVVAKTGRAEVLKCMGRLDEALAAYDAALNQFQRNSFAENGRAAVLCALGRFEEALESLPKESPTTREGWIAYHIRGMAMLRAGHIDEAAAIFLRGSEENPFAEDRDFFRSGLALAKLHEGAYEAVLSILSDVRDIGTSRVAGFLRGHSAGALGNIPAAITFLSATGPARNSRERELKAELERRFIASEPPEHDEEWLRQREVDCVLLAA